MTETHLENLSAGIDGELSKEELRFLLRRLDHETSLLDTWSRYHAARDGMRRELPALASSGFAARVMLAIDAEAVAPTQTVVAAQAGGRRRHWLRWSAGGAIAAGVAVAALMVAQPTADNDTRSAAAQVASAPSVAPAQQQQIAAVSTRPASTLQGTSAPATVPPWLSGNAASRLSERASMTLGGPTNDPMRPYQVRGYRTLNNGDGSYLLLIDPSQTANSRNPQAAAAQ